MTIWIIPLFADRKRVVRRGTQAYRTHELGENSKKVAHAAATLARHTPQARLAPATSAPPNSTTTGRSLMIEYLVTKEGCDYNTIDLVDVEGLPFRTVGEMEAIARMIMQTFKEHPSVEGKMHTVYLVGRWWHLPRAHALLKKQLRALAPAVDIRTHGIPSLNAWDIVREVALAWPKAILYREV